MDNFSRLPPIMRVASILGLLLPPGAIIAAVLVVLALAGGPWFSPQWGPNAIRLPVILWDLSLVGVTCRLTVDAYNARFRQLDRRPSPLDSWQGQARAILLPAAPAIVALMLAIVISPTAPAFLDVFYATLSGLVGVYFVPLLAEPRPERTVSSSSPATSPGSNRLALISFIAGLASPVVAVALIWLINDSTHALATTPGPSSSDLQAILLFAWITLGRIAPLSALLLGLLALIRAGHYPREKAYRGIAIAGVVLGALETTIVIVIFLLAMGNIVSIPTL